MSTRLDIARSFHALGFNVIPVSGKRAGVWSRWQTERQSEDQLAALGWEGQGITGLAAISGPSSGGLVCIDLDQAPGEHSLRGALGWLGLPRDYEWAVKTPGHGGGWHIWVVCPDLWEALEKAKLPTKAVLVGAYAGAAHAELRWRECYTLLPPSLHPDGERYEFYHAHPEAAPASVEGRKLLLLAEWGEEKKKADKPQVTEDYSAYIEAAIFHNCSRIASAQEGSRNEQLNASAYALGRMEFMGAEREAVKQRFTDAALRAGLRPHEIAATFDSGWESGAEHPRELPKPRERYQPEPEPEPTRPESSLVTLRDALLHLEEYTVKPMPEGIPFPWPQVNALARAMRPGWLTYLAGYTSHGKTAAAMEVALFAGEKDNRVLFVSGEMTEDELAVRAAQRHGLSSRRLYGGKPCDDDRRAVRSAAAMKAAGNIAILYDRKLASIEKHIADYQPALLIVDYLQYLDIGKGTRLEGTTRNSQGLKDLARRYKVPVLCLSQLRRPDRTMREERPRLDDLRDSGSIEQDADQVLFIWRKDIHRDQITNRPTYVGEIIVAKARMGELGELDYTFDPVAQRIYLA